MILHKDIVIEGRIGFSMISSLRIEESLNNHAIAYISGVLHEHVTVEEVYQLNFDSNFRIKAIVNSTSGTEEGMEEKVIFAGVPVDLTLKNMSGVKHLALTLKSHSIKLDTKRVNRSFQDINNPYKAVFKQIVELDYQGALVDTVSKGKTQGRLIIQYEETDWQLLKRLASQLNAVILPHMEANIPQIGIGTLDGLKYIENPPQFEIKKEVGAFIESARNFSDWKELDFVSSGIESYGIYKLCDIVLCNDVKYLVAGKISELQQGVLINSYRLQPPDSFRQNILYNEKLTGVSVEGKVIAVERDKVKLHLLMDSQQDINGAYWCNYDTPYTAEKSTGAYIMPENGEIVHLYFPNRDETQAYIRPAIRKDGKLNPKTLDPHTKYFGTANGKEIKMSPNSLSISAIQGKVHMTMTDSGGISFVSRRDLFVKGSNINIRAESVSLHGGDSLVLQSSAASLVMESEVDMDGIGIVNFLI